MIYTQFEGILLDAYGVFWQSNAIGPFPAGAEMMEILVTSGKIVGILSNTTQLVVKEIHKLEKHGLIQGKHFHFFLTSGEITRRLFLDQEIKAPRKTFYLFGKTHPKYSSPQAVFENSGYTETPNIDEADFIYIAIPHINGEDQTDQEVFRDALQKIRSHDLPMVCSNPDHFAHEGNPPRAVVRQGSIAAMYEEMGGKVVYIGKPHEKAYAAALDCFNEYKPMSRTQVLMVGDTPETDIRGAKRFGMHSALVLETGIMADRIAKLGLEKALESLPPDDYPDYLIPRFAHDV